MIVLKPYINLLNLSWIKMCLFLRNMEPLISQNLASWSKQFDTSAVFSFVSVLIALSGHTF